MRATFGTSFVAPYGVRTPTIAILALVLLGPVGCVSRPRGVARDRAYDPFDAARPAAAALVFEPVIAYDGPALDLSRDGRESEAFVGYPEGVAEYFYVRWDDRQADYSHGRRGFGSGTYDRYERRAISEKVGVLYR